MRQLFYLFLSENERDFIGSKLLKTYINRFIIEEDAENEIIEVHKFANVPDLNFPKFELMKKSKFLYSMFFESEIFLFFESLEEAAERSVLSTGDISIQNNDCFFVHFIIGISIPFNALDYCFLPCRKTHSNVTFLRGSNKSVLNYEKFEKKNQLPT